MEISVLVVEDETILSDGIVLTLKKAGYNVISALTAQDALDKLDSYTVKLILLDIFLPGANGLQLLHDIRSHSDTESIPVVVCTSAFNNVPQDILTKYGVEQILDKSTLTSVKLRETVNSILAK